MGRELIAEGVKVETDMFLRSLLMFPRRELFLLEWSWWRNVMMMGIDLRRHASLQEAIRTRNQETSVPTVSTNGKVVTLQVIASLGADVELGDVTRAFLESAELRRQGGKLFFRLPSSGLPGLHPQQLLEIRLPLCGLNDSPKRWFLEVPTFLRNIGWKSSALDECVFMFFDPDSKALAGILCLHVDDLSTWVSGQLLVQLVLHPFHQKDVAVWPYTVNILSEFTTFLATLHWRR